jgi:hypothetical protein
MAQITLQIIENQPHLLRDTGWGEIPPWIEARLTGATIQLTGPRKEIFGCIEAEFFEALKDSASVKLGRLSNGTVVVEGECLLVA